MINRLQDHLEKLSGFLAVAETGSFHRAAMKLGISQPGLSRSVRVLEDALGVSLFRRSVQGVQLTRQGAVLLSFAREIHSRARDAEIRMVSPEDPMSGRITIATFESLHHSFWPGLILRLSKDLPRLQIALRSDARVDFWKSLAEGSIDMIVDAEPRFRGNWTSKVLYKDRFGIFASRRSRSREYDSKVPIIWVPGAEDREGRTVESHLEDRGIQPSLRFDLDTFSAVLAYIEKGVGIGVLPLQVAKDSVESGKIKHVEIKGLPSSGFGEHRICATIRETEAEDPRLCEIISRLKAVGEAV